MKGPYLPIRPSHPLLSRAFSKTPLEINLVFKDVLKAATDGVYDLKYAVPKECGACMGSGLHNPLRCTGCGGKGYRLETLLIFTRRVMCARCYGRGITGMACTQCAGRGCKSQQTYLRIPLANVILEKQLLFSKKGGFYGSMRGDLALQFKFNRTTDLWLYDGILNYRITVSWAALVRRETVHDPFLGDILLPADLTTNKPMVLPRRGLDLKRGGRAHINIYLNAPVPKQ